MATSTRPLRDSRRRAEDVERDRRYEQLVELSPDAIFVHDGERIVSANAAALRLAGASKANQLVGRDVGLVLNPPFLKAVQHKLVDETGPEEYTAPVRDTFRRLDGTTVEVEVRAVVFLDRGLPAAHVVIRDITERLALEEHARANEQRLHRAQRVEAVGALAGGVAHELNNMLAIILGHAAFVVEDQTASAGTITDVRAITKAAERAAEELTQSAYVHDCGRTLRVESATQLMRIGPRFHGDRSQAAIAPSTTTKSDTRTAVSCSSR